MNIILVMSCNNCPVYSTYTCEVRVMVQHKTLCFWVKRIRTSPVGTHRLKRQSRGLFFQYPTIDMYSFMHKILFWERYVC